MAMTMAQPTNVNPVHAAIPSGLPTTTVMVPLNAILTWSRNPRKMVDEDVVSSIADSIQRNGMRLIHPIKLFRIDPEIDALTVYIGSTRHRAYLKLAAAREIPADFRIECVVDDIDEDQAFKLAVVENVARGTFHEVDRAEAIQDMAKRKVADQDIARTIGMSRADVKKAIAVARLDDRTKALLRANVRPFLWGYELTRANSEQRNRFLDDIAANPTAWADVSSVRTHINRTMIPAGHARFDWKAAGLNFKDDFFDGEMILDVEGFWKHQEKAIERIRDELQAEGHMEVRVVRGSDAMDPRLIPNPDALNRIAIIEVRYDGEVKITRDLQDPDVEESMAVDHDPFAIEDAADVAVKTLTNTPPKGPTARILAEIVTGVVTEALTATDALRATIAALLEQDEIRVPGDAMRTTDQNTMREALIDEVAIMESGRARRVALDALPKDPDELVEMLRKVVACTLPVTGGPKAPFEASRTRPLLRRVADLRSPDIRAQWTPDHAFLDTLDFAQAVALAEELLAGESFSTSGMSRRQIVAHLANAFAAARDGTSTHTAETDEILNSWLPSYVA